MEISLPKPPAHFLAFALWFATVVLGGGLLGLYLALFGPERFRDALGMAVVCSGFAAVLSLPVLLILPSSLRWAFTASTRLSCWLRLLLVVIGLYVVAAFCGCWLITRDGLNEWEVRWYTAPYLPAALVAAAFIYRAWLFGPMPRPSAAAHEEQMER